MFRVFNLEFYEAEERSVGKRVLVFVVMLVFSLVVGGVLMFLIKANPFRTYLVLIKGAVGSQFAISETILRTLPLLFIGLGTTICFRAGIWNIGGNGQILAGGMAATAVGLYLGNLPSPILIFITILAGALAGGIWSGIAGILRAKFNVNEIFTTIMMNYIMFYFSIFVLEEVWRETTWGMAWSEIIPENSWWPILFPKTRIHLGLLIAIIAVIYIYYLLFKTPLGYEIRATGFNPRAVFCKCKGIRMQRMIILVMFIAGILGGIAGAGQICGKQHRFSLDINANYGFMGIIAALLGGLNPIGVVLASFLLGGLLTAAPYMQVVTGVPITLIDVVEGFILIGMISIRTISLYRLRWRPKNE